MAQSIRLETLHLSIYVSVSWWLLYCGWFQSFPPINPYSQQSQLKSPPSEPTNKIKHRDYRHLMYVIINGIKDANLHQQTTLKISHKMTCKALFYALSTVTEAKSSSPYWTRSSPQRWSVIRSLDDATCSICGPRFTTPLFAVRGDRDGLIR